MGIDIDKAINALQNKRKVFCSEADFQLELAWILKEQNPNFQVRLEYVPIFDKKVDADKSMHIDIVLMNSNEFIPIELKYKTKKCSVDFDNEHYCLTNQGAQDLGRYFYLKDIERIEKIRKKSTNFQEGYAIFITNDDKYCKPRKTQKPPVDSQFDLTETKSGKMDWNSDVGDWADKYPFITFESTYEMNWNEYSNSLIKDKNANIFYILTTKIEKL